MKASTKMRGRWLREGKDCTGKAGMGGVTKKTGGWHDSKMTFPVLVNRGISELSNFSRKIITRKNDRIIEVETVLYGNERIFSKCFSISKGKTTRMEVLLAIIFLLVNLQVSKHIKRYSDFKMHTSILSGKSLGFWNDPI